MPAWSAAWLNVDHASVMSAAGTDPGSTLELPALMVVDALKESLPVYDLSTSAPAALNALCRELNPETAGEGWAPVWYACQCSPRIVCVPLDGPAQARISLPAIRNRIAVTGRT